MGVSSGVGLLLALWLSKAKLVFVKRNGGGAKIIYYPLGVCGGAKIIYCPLGVCGGNKNNAANLADMIFTKRGKNIYRTRTKEYVGSVLNRVQLFG